MFSRKKRKEIAELNKENDYYVKQLLEAQKLNEKLTNCLQKIFDILRNREYEGNRYMQIKEIEKVFYGNTKK